jgi:hypothetical protein
LEKAMLARETLAAYPDVPPAPEEPLMRFIDEVFSCAQACIACADTSLTEKGKSGLVACIRLNGDCADTCETLGRLVSRRNGLNRDVLRGVVEVCARACDRCAEECERLAARHRHCAICSEACRRCAAQCRVTMRGL